VTRRIKSNTPDLKTQISGLCVTWCAAFYDWGMHMNNSEQLTRRKCWIRCGVACGSWCWIRCWIGCGVACGSWCRRQSGGRWTSRCWSGQSNIVSTVTIICYSKTDRTNTTKNMKHEMKHREKPQHKKQISCMNRKCCRKQCATMQSTWIR
jgi:hypothetical protein